MIEWIKVLNPYFKIVIIAILIFFLGLILIERSCKNPYETKEYLGLKGQYEGYKAKVAEEEEIKLEAIKELQEENALLKEENEKIEELKSEALEDQVKIVKKLTEKQKEYLILKEKEGELLKKSEAFKALEEAFTLAIENNQKNKEIIKYLEKENANLRYEMSNKDIIILSLQNSIRKKDNLLKQAEDIIKAGERRSWLAKGSSLVVHGFALYGLAKAASEVF